MRLRRFTPTAVAIVLAGQAHADVINVPADQPTLAAAMSAAQFGDEIVLAPGTHAVGSQINVSVSHITIRSASGDAGDTSLQGSAGGLLNIAGIPVFNVEDVTVSGFDTFLFAAQSGVTLNRCNLSGNSLDSQTYGGIVASIVSSITAADCEFSMNTLNTPDSTSSVPRVSGGSLDVSGCTFDSNIAVFDSNSATFQAGAAIVLGTGSATLGNFEGADAQIVDTEFLGNTSKNGAAVASFGSSIIMDRCTMRSNSGSIGGAIYLASVTIGKDTLHSDARVENTVFNSNHAPTLDSGLGGFGAALSATSNSDVLMNSCTFVNNTADAGIGCVFLFPGASATVNNSLFDANTAPATSTLASQTHNLIDPAGTVFVDAAGSDGVQGTDDDNLRLARGSPAIDAGHNLSSGLLQFDRDGNDRYRDDPFTLDTGDGFAPIVDIGAYEYQPATNCLADVNGDGVVTPTDFTAWINAFNNQLPECDQNLDGACTQTDFTAWIINFNSGCF